MKEVKKNFLRTFPKPSPKLNKGVGYSESIVLKNANFMKNLSLILMGKYSTMCELLF